jgi:hypothetical protein
VVGFWARPAGLRGGRSGLSVFASVLCLLESSGVSFHRDQVSWCFVNLILIFVLSE